MAAQGKAAEAAARDEKANETRHTPESKARLGAAQEQLAERQAAAAERLAAALPEARQALREGLRAYAAAHTAFFGEAARAVTALAAALAAGGGAGGAAGEGPFGAALGAQPPRFVDEALALLQSKVRRVSRVAACF